MTLYFSHLRLARTPSTRALAPLLEPSGRAERRAAQHNLLWSVFSDGPGRRRDFLWREEASGSFFTLSARPPQQIDLFELHRVRAFAPQVSPGDQLEFQLRCNATRTEKTGATSAGGKERKRHIDLVMHALHQLPSRINAAGMGERTRATERMRFAHEIGYAWMQRQGEKAGFRVLTTDVADYGANVLPGHRGPRKGQPQFGVLDLTGRIEITDEAAFLARLPLGFGRAKAFGCGLMLIRRAP